MTDVCNKMSASPIVQVIVWVLLVTLGGFASGEIILTVTPAPARIYKGAEANVTVLSVTGLDNQTGAAVTQFSLDNKNDAKYFQIDSSGVLRTSQPINFSLGRVFQFAVRGHINNQMTSKQVVIVVSEKNKHAPKFNQTIYKFRAYRYGVGDIFGLVSVSDKDLEDYNRELTIFAAPGQESSNYIEVTKSGQIRLINTVPDHLNLLELTIVATDAGSPQLTSTAIVQIVVVMIRQPTIFCFATTINTVTLCWKNPMRGVSFDGYDIAVSHDANLTTVMPYGGEHSEACFTLEGTKVGARYFFTVTIRSTEPIDKSDGSIALKFNKTMAGRQTDSCVKNNFNVCMYLNPCKDRGLCSWTGPKEYTCNCYPGWAGKDCLSQNLCSNTSSTCKNAGVCLYKGHLKYECQCRTGFYGENCENYNTCLRMPCRNSGTCKPLLNGSYRCNCPPSYTGSQCQIQTNSCMSSPCATNKGRCIPVSDTDFFCECYQGYHGDRCELTNACLLESQPCHYQGTCVPQGTSFYCLCPPGATGQRCEYLDPCYTNPCRNGGTCTEGPVNKSYKCLCHRGYFGDQCEKTTNCASVQCNNGTCVEGPLVGQTRCECLQGFYGNQCEKYDVCSTYPCKNHGVCSSFGPNANHRFLFTCNCIGGWSGPDCSIPISRCTPTTCGEGGTCVSVQPDGHRCVCHEGYYMHDCSAFHPCPRYKCQNLTSCQYLSLEQFICKCSEGWLGDFCDYEAPCSPERNPCENSGQCRVVKIEAAFSQDSPTPLSQYQFETKCDCLTGHVGQRCQYVDPCSSSPCLHGHCRFLGVDENVVPGSEVDRYVCTCFQDYTGRNCDVPFSACEDIQCQNGGHCERGICICPKGFAGQKCEEQVLQCQNSDQTEDEDALCGVDKAMKSLLDDTSEPTKLNAEQVKNYTTQLLNLYNFTLRDRKYAWAAIYVLGNLGKVNISVSEQVETSDNINSRLREFLHNYTSEVKVEESTGQINISCPEVQVKVISLSSPVGKSNKESRTFEPFVRDNTTDIELNMTITIPATALENTNNEGGDTRVQFIGYRRSQLFVPATGFPDDGSSLHSQPVISATVKGREIINLTEPVEIRLLNISPGQNYTCVFWDTVASKWSTEGVSMTMYEVDSVTCASTHLTSFAILLDVNTERSISQEHEQVLTYLTYIGCAISMACLVITIATYAMFKCLNQEKSGKILLQLCTALLLMNIIFLAATVDVSSYSNDACLVVGMLLHYFLLASLMWMLVEAVEMYQALVTVFSKYERLYLLKRCLLAWGVPIVFAGITAAADNQAYYAEKTDRHFCFLSSKSLAAYYGALVGPSCAVILVNSVVFIMVARVILKPNFQQQLAKDSTVVTPAQVRGAFTVMFLLGITWVFGPLAINEAQTVFSYLFCICNSLQGFLIFVFRCLFNPEAKLAWLQLIQTGTLKRRRGPIKSLYSDTTSKGGDNHRASNSNASGSHYPGSAFGTTKTSLSKNSKGFHPHPHQFHNVNGWHPKLNGMGRGEECRSSSEIDRRLSSEYSVITKRESLPNEVIDTIQDAQTHL